MTEKRSIFERLRHAFAIEDAASFQPTEREHATAEKLCREVVRRRMTVPAVLLLEMTQPLNYLGAQALHFFQPFGTVLVDPGAWETFAGFIERRGSIEYLCRLIEDLEAARPEASESADEEPASEAAGMAERESTEPPSAFDESDSKPDQGEAD
ncbi:MAG: hypothetical protein O3A19_05540 [Planctomycetota bacterium]|nr:hypothetical protein [Planctomycetota bacterium]